jgi:F-type H+-transporting ATPase subunit gamma
MKAMDMVAASKLQRNKAKLKISRPLFQESQRIINTVRICENAIDNVFIKPRPVNNTAYVVISSDRGLCGGYNTNISQAAFDHMYENGSNEHILALGLRGRDYFRRRGKNIHQTYSNASESMFYANAEMISSSIISMYLSGKVDEVYVAYTYFESAMSYIPKVEKLLPLGEFDKEPEFRADSMKYEPDANHFLNYAVPAYLNAFLYDAMLESGSSEQASRMISMDSATKNATDITDELTLMYNRIRQAHITQEINEIVSGANATK